MNQTIFSLKISNDAFCLPWTQKVHASLSDMDTFDRSAAVEVCLLKQPMTRLLDATVTPGDRYPWRLLSASDSEGDSEGDC